MSVELRYSPTSSVRAVEIDGRFPDYKVVERILQQAESEFRLESRGDRWRRKIDMYAIYDDFTLIGGAAVHNNVIVAFAIAPTEQRKGYGLRGVAALREALGDQDELYLVAKEHTVPFWQRASFEVDPNATATNTLASELNLVYDNTVSLVRHNIDIWFRKRVA